MKKKCKLKISILALALATLALFGDPKNFFSVFVAVAIHELGHIFLAKLCKINMREMRLGIFGASLQPREGLMSYKEEIFICLGGPLLNFLSVIPTVILFDSYITKTFIMTSIALGVINLLPISGFDGGRIFSALAHTLFRCRTAERISSVLSFIIIFTLWCFSVYLMFKISASISLFVFSLSLFAKIFIPDIV